MNHLNRLCIGSLALFALVLGACNDDDNDDTADTPAAAGSATLAATPAPIPGARGASNPPTPGAGTRIDRGGRVAITAALVGTFSADPADTARERNAYNTSGLSNPAFLPTIKTSLGVLDGLDGNCGNQLLAGDGDDRYGALANVLLDDQLYLDSRRSGSVYLGIEAEAVQRIPAGQGAAGGREPGDDVVARSYSVLAAGKDTLSAVDDGVPADDAAHNSDVFPFLAAPQ